MNSEIKIIHPAPDTLASDLTAPTAAGQSEGALREAVDAFEEAVREEVRGAQYDTGRYPYHKATLRKERRAELDVLIAALATPPDARPVGEAYDAEDAPTLSFSGRPMPPDGIEGCVYCGEPFKAGEMILPEADGGSAHVACCGPERDAYVGEDGEPLKNGEPIPTGYPWQPKPAMPTRPVGEDALRDRERIIRGLNRLAKDAGAGGVEKWTAQAVLAMSAASRFLASQTQEGTGQGTGARCGYTECQALGRTSCRDCQDLAAPAPQANDGEPR